MDHLKWGEISFNKFMLVVSLEPDLDSDRRTGPLVLRGRSPSSRMEPHDMFQLSAFSESASAHDGMMHHEADVEEWPASRYASAH